jgi:hypothetical protein
LGRILVLSNINRSNQGVNTIYFSEKWDGWEKEPAQGFTLEK